jgi:hypothetical protein
VHFPDTRIGVAGDWHGNGKWAVSVLDAFHEAGIQTIFHAGDFGLGWPGGWNAYRHRIETVLAAHDQRLYITPGNHENWNFINHTTTNPDDGLKHVSDGSYPASGRMFIFPRNFRGTFGPTERSFVSLGGAPSIDYEHRRQDISWWRTEMITLREAEQCAADGYADVMFTHDAPDGCSPKVQAIIDTPPHLSFFSETGLRYAREGRQLMNIAYSGVRPELFIHGHFHETDTSPGFISLGCDGQPGNAIILDTETLDFEWLV